MENENNKGSLVGTIIVIIVLIIGAIYLFTNRSQAPVQPDNTIETGTSTIEVATSTVNQ